MTSWGQPRVWLTEFGARRVLGGNYNKDCSGDDHDRDCNCGAKVDALAADEASRRLQMRLRLRPATTTTATAIETVTATMAGTHSGALREKLVLPLLPQPARSMPVLPSTVTGVRARMLHCADADTCAVADVAGGRAGAGLVVHGAAAVAETLRQGAALVADTDTCKRVSGVGANMLSVRGVAMLCDAVRCAAARCDMTRRECR